MYYLLFIIILVLVIIWFINYKVSFKMSQQHRVGKETRGPGRHIYKQKKNVQASKISKK